MADLNRAIDRRIAQSEKLCLKILSRAAQLEADKEADLGDFLDGLEEIGEAEADAILRNAGLPHTLAEIRGARLCMKLMEALKVLRDEDPEIWRQVFSDDHSPSYVPNSRQLQPTL